MPVTMPYPPGLSPADWQKEMGKLGKIAGGKEGTGLSDKLRTLKAAYDKIDFAQLSFAASRQGVADNALDKAHVKSFDTALRNQLLTAREVKKAADDVIKAAVAIATAWAKNPLMPKKSVEAASGIAARARRFGEELPKAMKQVGDAEMVAAMRLIGDAGADEKAAKAGADKLAETVYKMQSLAPKVKQPANWQAFKTGVIAPVVALATKSTGQYPRLAPAIAELKRIAAQPNPTTPVEAEKLGMMVYSHCLKLLKAVDR